MRKFLLAWLVLVFCLNGVFSLSVDVTEDVLIYPGQEFYLVMNLENSGEFSDAVEIFGVSEGLNSSWNRSVLLLGESGVKVGFIINPVEREGNYQILWLVQDASGEVIQVKTRVLVSSLEGAFGDVVGYYGFELDKLGDGEFASDARKNFKIAKDLADRGMIFEATKYLDFTRESFEMAVEEESPSRIGGLNWIVGLRFFGFVVLGVVGILFLFYFLFKLIARLKKFKFSVLRTRARKIVKKKIVKPKYILEVAEVRRRIMRIKNLDRRQNLISDLDNAEEKFRIGLPMLGRAYLKRIGRRVDGESV